MSSWPLSEADTGYKTKRRGLRLEHQRGFLVGGPQKWDFCHSNTKSACYNVSCFCNSYLGGPPDYVSSGKTCKYHDAPLCLRAH